MDIHPSRNIALFLGGQAISLFGSMLVQYSAMWYVVMTTQSGVMATVAVVVGLLPAFFVSPFGGVWADRYNRRNLINLSDGGIAFVTLIIAMAFLLGYKEIWILFAGMAIRGVGQGIQTPAVSSFIPQLVNNDGVENVQPLLVKINGINTSIQSVAALAGPIVAGALMTVMPLEYIFFIDIFTAIVGISILQFLVKIPAAIKNDETEHSVQSYFQDLKEGIQYVWRTKWIRQIFVFMAVMAFCISPTAFLSPLQVTRNFGNDVWRLTAIEVAYSGGMLLGGLFMGFWHGFKRKGVILYALTIWFAWFTAGIEVVALGVVKNFWLYCFAFFLMGPPIGHVTVTTLLQTRTDAAYIGRVFGVEQMIWSLMMPVAMLVFGPLADIVNIDYLMIGCGAVIIVGSIPVLMSKELKMRE